MVVDLRLKPCIIGLRMFQETAGGVSCHNELLTLSLYLIEVNYEFAGNATLSFVFLKRSKIFRKVIETPTSSYACLKRFFTELISIWILLHIEHHENSKI